MKEFDFFKFNSNLIETMQFQSQTINSMFEPVLKVQQTFEPVFKAQQILAVNEAPFLKLAKEQEQILKKTTPLMFGTVQTYKSIYDDLGNSFKNSMAELNKTTAFLKDTLNVYPMQNIPFTNKEVPKTNFIDYINTIDNHTDLETTIPVDKFNSAEEYEQNLDKCLDTIAEINDKQPLTECTINSKTVEDLKKRSTKEKTEIVLNGLQSIIIFVKLITSIIAATGNINITAFSNNVTYNYSAATSDKELTNNLNISICSNNVTYNYFDSSEDEAVSSKSTGENTILPPSSILKE